MTDSYGINILYFCYDSLFYRKKKRERRWLKLTFYIKYCSQFFFAYLVFIFWLSIILRILKNCQAGFIFPWFNLISVKVKFNNYFQHYLLHIMQIYTSVYTNIQNFQLYQAYFVLRTWQHWNFAAGKWRHRRINCKQHHLIISSWNCSMFPM